MKKIMIMLIMVLLCIGSVFALDLSVGLNAEYDYEWKNVSIKSKFTDIGGLKDEIKAMNRPYTNLLGANAFFDAQYLRLSVGINCLLGGERSSYNVKSNIVSAKEDVENFFKGLQNTDVHMTCVNVSLVGKLPFKLAFARLYPFVGIDASFNVFEKKGNNEEVSDYLKRSFGRWCFISGLGADLYLGKHFFIDVTSVFGIELVKPDMTEKSFRKQLQDNLKSNFTDFSVKDSHNYKVNFVIGVGYTF